MPPPNDPIEIVLTRTVPAGRETVFAAWTDPAQMAQWWGTSDHPGTAAEIDLHVGGSWRACMTSSSGEDHWAGGVYQTVDPPRHLGFTFAWEAYPDSISDIDITFIEVVTGTEVTFHQRLQVSSETAAGYRAGWEDTLDRLVTHVSAATVPNRQSSR